MRAVSLHRKLCFSFSVGSLSGFRLGFSFCRSGFCWVSPSLSFGFFWSILVGFLSWSIHSLSVGGFKWSMPRLLLSRTVLQAYLFILSIKIWLGSSFGWFIDTSFGRFIGNSFGRYIDNSFDQFIDTSSGRFIDTSSDRWLASLLCCALNLFYWYTASTANKIPTHY